jgi:cytochrome o ubiquinol oxidase subunit II
MRRTRLLQWSKTLTQLAASLSTVGRSTIPCIALASCSTGVLDSHGSVGAAEAKILVNSVVIMLAIGAPTMIATLAFAWWFRAGNLKAQYRPEWVYSGRVELVVWGLPFLVILFLSGLIWIGSHELDPFKPIAGRGKPVEVQVVSLDWKWLFIYPSQSVASVNELVVPAEAPIHFSLTSGSVMNAFFVPQLGGMIATMNGMTSQLWLKADRAGDYYGESAQFSGDGFSGMHFTLRAVTQEAFDDWIAKARGAQRGLTESEYAELARESQDVTPFAYRSVEPGLFENIVSGKIPPREEPLRRVSGAEIR